MTDAERARAILSVFEANEVQAYEAGLRITENEHLHAFVRQLIEEVKGLEPLNALFVVEKFMVGFTLHIMGELCRIPRAPKSVPAPEQSEPDKH